MPFTQSSRHHLVECRHKDITLNCLHLAAEKKALVSIKVLDTGGPSGGPEGARLGTGRPF